MGVGNMDDAFNRFSGKITPQAMNVLVYMAGHSLDEHDWPWFRRGHAHIAEKVLGKSNPAKKDLRAVENAFKQLREVGAVTTTRRGAARADGNVTAEHHLNLNERGDGCRRAWEVRQAAAPDSGDPSEFDALPETKNSHDTRENLTQHPSVFDATPVENRRPLGFEELEEKKQGVPAPGERPALSVVPPLFPRQCPQHQDEINAGPCGGCGDARRAETARELQAQRRTEDQRPRRASSFGDCVTVREPDRATIGHLGSHAADPTRNPAYAAMKAALSRKKVTA